MGIFKKATNLNIIVRGTYTIVGGTSYEEAEEVIIEATNGDLEFISQKRVIIQGLGNDNTTENVPILVEMYYTDLEGNKITKGVVGQEIYLIVEGESLSGKEANLDLTDNEIDFEYKGERLEYDILKGYIFQNEALERIKLKVIEQKNN